MVLLHSPLEVRLCSSISLCQMVVEISEQRYYLMVKLLLSLLMLLLLVLMIQKSR